MNINRKVLLNTFIREKSKEWEILNSLLTDKDEIYGKYQKINQKGLVTKENLLEGDY